MKILNARNGLKYLIKLSLSVLAIFNVGPIIGQIPGKFGIQVFYSPSLSKNEINNPLSSLSQSILQLYDSNGAGRFYIGSSYGAGAFFRANRKFQIDINFAQTVRGQQSGKKYFVNGITTYPENYDGYCLVLKSFSNQFSSNVTYDLQQSKHKRLSYVLVFGLLVDWTTSFEQKHFLYSKTRGRDPLPIESHFRNTIGKNSPVRLGINFGLGVNYQLFPGVDLKLGITWSILTNRLNPKRSQSMMPTGLSNNLVWNNTLSIAIF